jgi:hypothetical protein
MGTILSLVASLIGLVAFGCFVYVLIKLFQNEGTGKGILGLICGLYTLVWGWMNAGKLGIRNIMLIWTATVVLAVILNVAATSLLVAESGALVPQQ